MSDIRPAMSPEDWKHERTPDLSTEIVDGVLWLSPECDDIRVDADGRHALAALALYGQSFGFTWDDVDDLRLVAEGRMAFPGTAAHGLRDHETLCRVARIADRVEALLPPREEADEQTVRIVGPVVRKS